MKSTTIVCLVALLSGVVLTAGCLNVVNKANGGGTFISEEFSINAGDLVNFGFNVKFDSETNIATVQFQLTDQVTGQTVHVSNMTMINLTELGIPLPPPSPEMPNAVFFTGYDRNGKLVIVSAIDAGEPGPSADDGILVWYDVESVYEVISEQEMPTWAGILQEGNIQTH